MSLLIPCLVFSASSSRTADSIKDPTTPAWKIRNMPNVSSYLQVLDTLSMVNFYSESRSKTKSSRFYEIEHVVSRRVKQGKVSICLNIALFFCF